MGMMVSFKMFVISNEPPLSAHNTGVNEGVAVMYRKLSRLSSKLISGDISLDDYVKSKLTVLGVQFMETPGADPSHYANPYEESAETIAKSPINQLAIERTDAMMTQIVKATMARVNIFDIAAMRPLAFDTTAIHLQSTTIRVYEPIEEVEWKVQSTLNEVMRQQQAQMQQQAQQQAQQRVQQQIQQAQVVIPSNMR